MNKDIDKLNLEQEILIKNYPDLFEVLRLAQEENDRKYLDNYFYYTYAEGQKQSISQRLAFADNEIDNYLKQMEKFYSKNKSLLIEPDEIPQLFLECVNDFLDKKKLRDFSNINKNKQLNSLRKHLKNKIYYWLMAESEKRQGLKVKQVGGKKYKVNNSFDVISFESIEPKFSNNDTYEFDDLPITKYKLTKAAQDFLDSEAYKAYKINDPDMSLEEFKKQLDLNESINQELELEILDNYQFKYRNLLTDNQKEKIDLLLKALIESPNLIYDWTNESGELIKSKIGEILFPDSFVKENSGEVGRRVDSLINSIQKRINKFDDCDTDKKEIKNYNEHLLKYAAKQDISDLVNKLVSEKELIEKYCIDNSAYENFFISYPTYFYIPVEENEKHDLVLSELIYKNLRYDKYKLLKIDRVPMSKCKNRIYIIQKEFEKVKKSKQKNIKKVI